MERLDKLLSHTGRWSRKEVKALVKEGRVQVAGAVVKGPEAKYPLDVEILVDGAPVRCRRHQYLLLHKPAGVVSSTQDPRDKTVLDLLPAHLRQVGLFPVGRLDKDTEGLLLLTDDGELAHRLLAPGKHVEKVYYAQTEAPVDQEDIAAFAAGMTLGNGEVCLSARLVPIQDGCLVTLLEGKYHQVKRMLAARGKPVRYLKRLSMGPLRLPDDLPPGQWRPLTPAEEKALGLQGPV